MSETGWLIELKQSVSKQPTWYGVTDEDVLGWTTNNLKAIRFARVEDAERVIHAEDWTEAFASDHQWGTDPGNTFERYWDALRAIECLSVYEWCESRDQLKIIIDRNRETARSALRPESLPLETPN